MLSFLFCVFRDSLLDASDVTLTWLLLRFSSAPRHLHTLLETVGLGFGRGRLVIWELTTDTFLALHLDGGTTINAAAVSRL